MSGRTATAPRIGVQQAVDELRRSVDWDRVASDDLRQAILAASGQVANQIVVASKRVGDEVAEHTQELKRQWAKVDVALAEQRDLMLLVRRELAQPTPRRPRRTPIGLDRQVTEAARTIARHWPPQ
jgi:hypothetical protein